MLDAIGALSQSIADEEALRTHNRSQHRRRSTPSLPTWSPALILQPVSVRGRAFACTSEVSTARDATGAREISNPRAWLPQVSSGSDDARGPRRGGSDRQPCERAVNRPRQFARHDSAYAAGCGARSQKLLFGVDPSPVQLQAQFRKRMEEYLTGPIATDIGVVDRRVRRFTDRLMSASPQSGHSGPAEGDFRPVLRESRIRYLGQYGCPSILGFERPMGIPSKAALPVTQCSYWAQCSYWERIPMITYQTERLILTAIQPEHEPELFKLHNDSLVQEVIFRNVPQSIDDIRKTLDWALTQWRKTDFGLWMVYEKTNDGPIFIGRCGLGDYEDDLEFVNILCQHGVGRGLGAEAAHFAITHALRVSSKEKIVGFIAHGNIRSERAAKMLGMRYVDNRQYKYDGRFRKYYEMTREEYFSQPHHQGAG